MPYALLVHQKARKELDNLPTLFRRKIASALDAILRDPYSGKKLSGELLGKYSVRAWPYRIVYQIDQKKGLVSVLHISHRKDAYK